MSSMIRGEIDRFVRQEESKRIVFFLNENIMCQIYITYTAQAKAQQTYPSNLNWQQ